jgi:hypothetical protein
MVAASPISFARQMLTGVLVAMYATTAFGQYGRGRVVPGGGMAGAGGGMYGGGGTPSNAVARPGGDSSLDDSVRLFLQLDQDGDGHLDPHELPPALYGLLNYDQDGDGRISAAEYLGALRNVQLEMSLDQQCRHQYGPNAEFDGIDACR